MEKENSFLGRGWSFPPTFSNTGIVGVEMVEKELDIEQSLEVLLNTGKGERIMLPDYGCDLHLFLFNSINDSEMNLLQEMIRSSIINYEPRIELNDVIIDRSDFQDGIIRVKLDYTVATTNTRFNLVLPYYKVEGTGIPKLFHKQIAQNIASGDNTL